MSTPYGARRTRSLVIRAGIASGVGPLIAAATAPVIAHSLGPEGRGALAAVLTPLTLADAIGSLGLPIAATYFVARGMPARRFIRLATPYLVLSWLVTYGVLAVLAIPVAQRHGLDYGFVVLVWGSTGAALLFNVVRAIRMAQEEWQQVNWERVVGPCLRLAAIAALVAVGLDTVESVTLTYIGTGILASLLLLPRSKGGWRAPAETTATKGEIRRYSAKSWATTLLTALNARVDQFLLVFLVASSALGSYVVAVTVAELPGLLAAVVYRISLSRAAKGQSWAETLRQSRLTTAATGLLSLGLAAVAIPTVTLIFGPGFGDVRWLAPILMLATVMLAPVTILSGALSGMGRPAQAAAPQVAALGVDVLLVVGLSPWLGAAGAAVAWAVSAAVAMAVALLIVRREGVAVTLRMLLLPGSHELQRALSRRREQPGAASTVAAETAPADVGHAPSTVDNAKH